MCPVYILKIEKTFLKRLIHMDGEIVAGCKFPAPLKEGDKVAIVSPASKINPLLIDAAVAQLRREGFDAEVMPHAKGECGSFSGTVAERLCDMRNALEDGDVRAVLCSRGGYGAVHLLGELDGLPAEAFDKWLIGFSDITALHALWGKKGVASMHGAMTKYIGKGPRGFRFYDKELDVLRGGKCDASFACHDANVDGVAMGKIAGGNLAVLGGLIGTPFDPIKPGCILFIEDIAEPIYKVERILWQLRLKGVFDVIGGLMVGQFTEYSPSADHASVEDMMESFFRDYSFPRAYGLPIGHIDDNHPLLLNTMATLTVTSASTTLTYR